MSYVTTYPAALLAAAGALQDLGTTLAAEDAAAAPPTTSIAPAAADEVSALQAAQFAAYGSWYQQVSAQAKAVHQQLVNTFGGQCERVRRDRGGQSERGGLAIAVRPEQRGIRGGRHPGGDNARRLDHRYSLQLLPERRRGCVGLHRTRPGAVPAGFGELESRDGRPPAVGPRRGARVAGAGRGRRAGSRERRRGCVARRDVGAAELGGGRRACGRCYARNADRRGLDQPTGHAAPITTVPAGVPSMASAGRSNAGFGAPRYGLRPIVMPKPTVV